MRLALHLIAAITWGVLVQWPWGTWVFHALGALAVIHIVAPFWFHFVFARPFHRAFLFGPLVLAALDAGFVLYCWRGELWADLTMIVVAILGAGTIVGLLYSLLVMTLLDRWRSRRDRTRAPSDELRG